MSKNVDIWLVGNTGLRNPNRIQEGFRIFANSPFVGNIRGNNEVAFMNLLNKEGIIHNESGKDQSGSHARKWRLMFAKNGFIYPQLKKKEDQDKVGPKDDITPFGRVFLQADTVPAIQECFLRAMSVEKEQVQDSDLLFSPLRWMLSLMLELEKRTGSTELNRIEFALWGQTTNPSYDVSAVVDSILDLRSRRSTALSKRAFDNKEIDKRSLNYSKKKGNFLDYSDMNMRYLRISGMFQRKGNGIMIVPSKHALAEMLSCSVGKSVSLVESYNKLCNGAMLPLDNIQTATKLLNDLKIILKEKHILYDISDITLDSVHNINIARKRLEDLLSKTDETEYAKQQCGKWQEISEYMTLLISGGGKKEIAEDYVIEVPKDETPAYFEWVIWRAMLAINHMVNKPYEARGFLLDADFMPISTASGGKADLYCEFSDFNILTEVTMSSSSRQEAMEGEPVRRHVSDAMLKYNSPVYGLFIAISVDMNTAETFRHGIWYTKNGSKQRLDIVPLSLAQFQKYFVSMFENNMANPKLIQKLIENCELKRDSFDAPQWKEYIDSAVNMAVESMFVS